MSKKIYQWRALSCLWIFGLALFIGCGPSGQPLLMWKATKGEQTVHLMGSIHTGKEKMYPLASEIMDAFQSSEALAVEVDITKVDTMTIQAEMGKRALEKPDGKKNISADLEKKVKACMTSKGLPESAYKQYRLWYLIQLCAPTPKTPATGYSPKWGVDLHFINKAGKKKVIDLETVKIQLDSIAAMGDDPELFYEYVQIPSDLDVLFNAWASGDPERIEGEALKGLKSNPALKPIYEVFLFERNRNMVKKLLTTLSAHKKLFVVVGAAHLVGQDGMPDLMRKEGFTVEAVRTATKQTALPLDETKKSLLIWREKEIQPAFIFNLPRIGLHQQYFDRQKFK